MTRSGSGAKAKELTATAVLLLAVIIAQMLMSGSWRLLSRPLWLDEIFTAQLSLDPSFAHSMTALRGGVDANPPALYILIRIFSTLTASSSETMLRIFSTLSVLLAALGAYALARRFFGRLPSFAAAMVLLSSGAVIEHEFFVRFYGPSLAAIIWFCYLLIRTRSPKPSVFKLIFLGLLAVLICTLHYFGIISLFLTAAADWCTDDRPWPQKIRSRLPIFAGPLALAACMPFYFGQKADLSVATWMAPTDFNQIRALLWQLWDIYPVTLLVMAFWLSAMLRPVHDLSIKPSQSTASLTQDLSALAAPTALLLVPVVIVLFSVFVQSAMMVKYALNVVAAHAVIGGYLASRTRSWLLGLAIVAMIFLGVTEHVGLGQTDAYQPYTDSMHVLQNTLTTLPPDEPIAYSERDVYYAMVIYSPQTAARSYFIDFANNQPAPEPKTARAMERDLARKVAKQYPQFQIIPPERLPNRFILVARSTDLPTISGWFGHLIVRPLGGRVYEVERK